MSDIKKSHKLEGVCYDIRGPVLAQAKKMEDEGQKVLKLNIGNPAAFGFDMPEDMHRDIIRNLYSAQGYCDSKGLYSARVAVYQHYQQRRTDFQGTRSQQVHFISWLCNKQFDCQ